MVKPYVPQGCDQQGRYPQAAEAATELGMEEPEDTYGALVTDVAISVVLIGVIALIVVTAIGLWRAY